MSMWNSSNVSKSFFVALLLHFLVSSSAVVGFIVPVQTSRSSNLMRSAPYARVQLTKDDQCDTLCRWMRTNISSTTKNSLCMSGSSSAEPDINGTGSNITTIFVLSSITFLYWYWLVLGAAAKANGLPFIPDFIPMVPGWPPSEEDLQAVNDDSYHFFYLSELLNNVEAPYAPPTRLAVSNLAEAWIFAFLPALWADGRKRLPKFILLTSWAVLGIGLTNAFLAPYLLITELLYRNDDQNINENGMQGEKYNDKNQVVSVIMGGISASVGMYALYEVIFSTNTSDWVDFIQECQQDRTYFAFVIDLILFSCLQPFIIQRVNGKNDVLDFIPFVGLIGWLFSSPAEPSK